MNKDLDSAAEAIDERLQAERNTTVQPKTVTTMPQPPRWLSWALIGVSCLLFLNAFGGRALFSDSAQRSGQEIKADMLKALQYTQDPLERYKQAHGRYPEELPNPAARAYIDYQRIGDGYILTMEQGLYSVQLKEHLDD